MTIIHNVGKISSHIIKAMCAASHGLMFKYSKLLFALGLLYLYKDTFQIHSMYHTYLARY